MRCLKTGVRIMNGKFQAAPMDTTAKVVTILIVLMAGGFPFLPGIPIYAIMLLPLVILIAWLFSVNGFTLQEQQLIIHRPFWSTVLQLPTDLVVELEPDVKKGLFKTMGNGGMFGYTGGFRNKKLGNFKAYATDWDNAISLCSETTGFCIVITPDESELFLSSFH